jgi:hypothetical protein
VRPLLLRRLAALVGIPPALVSLTALGPAPAQPAANGTAAVLPGVAGLSERAELGVALVALGLLIIAVTIVRLRIQARRRRSPAFTASRWAKVTDTWGVYSTATPRRVELHSRW